jgi:hypothetical protein
MPGFVQNWPTPSRLLREVLPSAAELFRVGESYGGRVAGALE